MIQCHTVCAAPNHLMNQNTAAWVMWCNIRITHWPDVSWNTYFSKVRLWLVRINTGAKFHNKASGRQTKERRKRPSGELTEWETSGSLAQRRSLSESLLRPFLPECDSCIKNRATANSGNWTAVQLSGRDGRSGCGGTRRLSAALGSGATVCFSAADGSHRSRCSLRLRAPLRI